MERLQKFLAGAGIGSRRLVEQWIAEGRVTVDGAPAILGQKVSGEEKIQLDGRRLDLRRDDTVRVLAFRKRAGQLVTRHDPERRPTVFRKLPKLRGSRWIAVGRLDLNTSGMLLMTTSGELARRLMHPKYQLDREYAVRVLGPVDDAMLERLRKGVELEDGLARFDRVVAASESGEDSPSNRWFNVTVREGRNRIVRRLWESQDCQVSRLIRVRYGPVVMRGIRDGSYRELDPAEVEALCAMVEWSPKAEAKARSAQQAKLPERQDAADAEATSGPKPRRR